MEQISNLEQYISRIPKFMRPNLAWVSSLMDLQFQLQREIDLASGGEFGWTDAQLETAKAFCVAVSRAAQNDPNATELKSVHEAVCLEFSQRIRKIMDTKK